MQSLCSSAYPTDFSLARDPGASLSVAMRCADMTPDRLARVLDVPEWIVRGWTRGTIPQPEMRARIASTLDVSPREVFA